MMHAVVNYNTKFPKPVAVAEKAWPDILLKCRLEPIDILPKLFLKLEISMLKDECHRLLFTEKQALKSS